jgi:hypothetical protein
VLAKQLGDEVVLYLADGSAVHVLNRTALAIWSLCDGSHTAQEMEQTLRVQYAIPEEVDVAEDVRRTLGVFAAKGLVC